MSTSGSTSAAAAAPAAAAAGGGGGGAFDIKLRESVVCVLMKPKKKGPKGEDGLEGFGSGFIIQTLPGKCIVMTCYHILEDFKDSEHTIHVRMCGGDVELPAKIMSSHDAADLLILKVTGLDKEYRALEFGSSADVPLNDTVYLLGYISPPLKEGDQPGSPPNWSIPKVPGASPGKTVGPIIRGRNGVSWNEEIQVDCRSKPGLSGGPVLWHGKVVGVQKSKIHNICIAVATSTVNTVLHEWLPAPLSEPEKRMTTEVAIKCLEL